MTCPPLIRVLIQTSMQMDEPMDMDMYGPSLPLGHWQTAHSVHGASIKSCMDLPMQLCMDPCTDPCMAQIRVTQIRFLTTPRSPVRLTQLSLKSTRTKENPKPGLNRSLSHPLERNQSPLFKPRSLLSQKGLLLNKKNSNQIQTQFSI